MAYTKARLKDALRAFRHISNCRERRALPSEKLASRLRNTRQSAKVTPLDGVNWQAKSDGSGSDDDDYDPTKERRITVTRRNKKKRKADELTDGDYESHARDVKKVKGDHSLSTIHNDNTFFTIRLTSDKGRQTLRDIDKLGNVPKVSRGPSKPLPKAASRSSQRYFDKYLSSDMAQDREVVEIIDQGLMEMDVDAEDEFVSNRNKVLRSGKVVEKPAKKQKKSTKGRSRLTPPVSDDEPSQHAIVTKRPSDKSAPSTNRIHLNGLDRATPVTQTPIHRSSVTVKSAALKGASSKDPWIIDSDSDNEAPKPRARLQPHISDSFTVSKSKTPATTSVIKYETALPPSPISLAGSSSRSPAPQISSTILTISTAFAHPLIFLPPTTPREAGRAQCHFCRDPRMAIVGLGRSKIEVFTLPDNPFAYEEMGDGFRSRGFSSTTICFGCVEKRVRMMKCHQKSKGPNNDSAGAGMDGDANWGFQMMRVRAKVGGVNSNILYRKWLFPTPQEKRAGKNEQVEAPLETCSICPMPALWRCCKDKNAGPASISAEKENCLMRARANTMTMDACGRPQTPDLSKCVKTVPAYRAPANANIVVVDSDSEDGLSAQWPKRTNLQLPVDVARSAPSPSTTAGAASSMDQIHLGCGLKLCGNCKLTVVDRCHGFLDKRSIMGQFHSLPGERRSVITGRADVEFLFNGSMAHRFYEDQVKQRYERSIGRD